MTGKCAYPGDLGFTGSLDPENVEIAEVFKRYVALGPWALDMLPLPLDETEARELVELMYELTMENNRLRLAYPSVCHPWDTAGVQDLALAPPSSEDR